MICPRGALPIVINDGCLMGSEVESDKAGSDKIVKQWLGAMPSLGMPILVLASASPRRLALLNQIGIEPHHFFAANLDETPKRGEHPRYLARRLARQKVQAAEEALRKLPHLEQALILAADTVVAVGRTALPKPQTQEEARECLRLLSGRSHKVFTAVCLLSGRGRVHQRLVETRVRFVRLGRRMMDAYLASEEWQGKSGGYAIQGLAGSFVTRIVGSYSNVVGLPLAETAQLLQSQDYPLTSEWDRD